MRGTRAQQGNEQALFEGMPDKTMYFTHCLAEAMRTAAADRKKLSVQEAFAYSRQRMRTLLLRQANAPREQEPQMFDSDLLPISLLP